MIGCECCNAASCMLRPFIAEHFGSDQGRMSQPGSYQRGETTRAAFGRGVARHVALTWLLLALSLHFYSSAFAASCDLEDETRISIHRGPTGCLPHPRGAREASEHGFGGGTHGEAVRVGASSTHTTRMGYVSQYVVANPPGGGWERDVTDPTGAVTKRVQGGDGSITSTSLDVQGKTLVTTVAQQGPDPRYAMLLPVATSTTTTLEPSKLSMTTTDTRTASVGSDFFALSSQTDVVTINPGADQETLTATYTAGSPNNTLAATTTTGRTIMTTLDAQDRVIGVAIPGIAPTSIAYNTAPCPGGGEGCGGRVTSVTATSGTGETRTWTTHYQYSPDTGFASSAVDALDQAISWTRDPVGRVLQTQLPNLTSTSSAAQNQVATTYDKNGNLSTLAVPSLTSPAPEHTFPSYSPIDDLATYSPPPLSPALVPSNTSYAYNYDEQLTSVVAPESSGSGTVSLGYDTVGRLTTVDDALSGVTTTLTYAASGLPLSVSTSDGEALTYGYGVDGPLLMSKTWSGNVAGSVSVTHDSFLRTASRSVNGAKAVKYLFDADGLFSGTSGLVTSSLTRDFNGKNGLLTGTTLGSVTDAVTYDGFGALATYAASYKGAAVYSSSITSRDADGRITGLTETSAGKAHTWAFVYDPHGDLASATEDGTTTAYDFDPNGNRLSAGGHASTYDAQDRLLTSPGATYTYTNNGDLLTKVTSAGTATYAYDLRGALRSVALPSGDTVSYVIDGSSRRVGRTWTHGSQTVTQGFLYDNALQIAAELDGTGNVVSTFVYGTRVNVPDAMVRGGKTYRIVSDWRGSVRAVVEASAGTVVETIDYDAWGNATVNDTTCAAGAVCAPFQPFGFAGGMFDRETGLVRFGARDYDASVGRWTQKDVYGTRGDPVAMQGFPSELFYVYA
jgi:RHS repeat-associated protein